MGGNLQMLGMLAVLVGMGSAVAAQAQEQEAPSPPCRDTVCKLAIEWRRGVPNVIDQRYGNPYQFEGLLQWHLQEAGYSFVSGDGAREDVVTIRVQPEMTRAMCDRTPGTNTDESCQTVGEVRVEILNTDPELDIRNSLLIRGRCGADQLMDVERMSEFVAATIDYELHSRKDRRRPSSRC